MKSIIAIVSLLALTSCASHQYREPASDLDMKVFNKKGEVEASYPVITDQTKITRILGKYPKNFKSAVAKCQSQVHSLRLTTCKENAAKPLVLAQVRCGGKLLKTKKPLDVRFDHKLKEKTALNCKAIQKDFQTILYSMNN